MTRSKPVSIGRAISKMPTLFHVLILLGISLPYCVNLGQSSLWDANESFYAETPREMLVTGNYLAPQFNFQPRTQKPPLTYWAVLFSYKIFGVSEFAVRVPGALAVIGVLLFTYGIGRLLFHPASALIAALIVATTPRIFILSRRLPIDILLLFFLMGTLFFLVRAIQRNATTDWVLAYLCASLGFLTKGPIAVVIPAGACLLWNFSNRRLQLASARPIIGLLIFIGVVLPWHVLIYRASGWTYISAFFLRDNLGRFAAESMGPSRGPLYYFPVYAADFFPWSILGLSSVCLLWANRKTFQPLNSIYFGLPLAWCVVVFALFSLSKSKQEYYIAPLYPAMAIVLSALLERTLFTRHHSPIAYEKSLWSWGYGIISVILLSLSFVTLFVISSVVPGLPAVLHYMPSLLLLAAALMLGYHVFRNELARCFLALAAPLWSVYAISGFVYLPALEANRPVKDFCRIIEAHSSNEDEAGYFRIALPSMPYYLRRPIYEENDAEEMVRRFQSAQRVLCILTEKDYRYFVGQKRLILHIWDRRVYFTIRLRALLDGRRSSESLVLVSNKPYPAIGDREISQTP